MPLSSRAIAVMAIAITLTACAGGLGNSPGGASATTPLAIRRAVEAPLVARPTKLNFTTAPVIRFTVGETGYSGRFTIRSADSSIVKVTPAAASGPGPVQVKALAVSAGKTTVTVTDALGHTVNIPATVTTGVVIIQ